MRLISIYKYGLVEFCFVRVSIDNGKNGNRWGTTPSEVSPSLPVEGNKNIKEPPPAPFISSLVVFRRPPFIRETDKGV